MTRPVAISSIEARDHRAEAFVQPVSIERRSRVRFPLELRVRYRALGRGCPFTGVGWVVNMSSGGVLVAYQHEISAGTRMELNIEWPSLLDGRVPLQLVAVGKVVRCETSSFAVSLGGYQFRTTRRTVIPIDVSCGDVRMHTAKRSASA
jgi:PilZ domain-containing protein